MNLADVMDEIAARLNTISTLRVFPYPADAVTDPAAIVLYPDEITFDETYGRGMDRISLPVLVVLGKPHDRSTRDRVVRYCNGSGADSVKAALETGTTTAFDTIRVESIEFGIRTIGGTDYAGAEFTLDIAGRGA